MFTNIVIAIYYALNSVGFDCNEQTPSSHWSHFVKYCLAKGLFVVIPYQQLSFLIEPRSDCLDRAITISSVSRVIVWFNRTFFHKLEYKHSVTNVQHAHQKRILLLFKSQTKWTPRKKEHSQ